MKVIRKSWKESEVIAERNRRLREGLDVNERCSKCKFQWFFSEYNECPICYRNNHQGKDLRKLPVIKDL